MENADENKNIKQKTKQESPRSEDANAPTPHGESNAEKFDFIKHKKMLVGAGLLTVVTLTALLVVFLVQGKDSAPTPVTDTPTEIARNAMNTI